MEMPALMQVDDIISYLMETGWEKVLDRPSASTWQHEDGYEVLVPAHDGMGDGERRAREILRCLSAVEDRQPGDIAREISHPRLDRQLFRTFPADHDAGYTSLLSGLQAVQGVRNILATSARTLLQGPHFAFAGRSPAAVGDVLRAAELGPSRIGSYVIEVCLAVDVQIRHPSGGSEGGRAVLAQMFEAMLAAHSAVLADTPSAFDGAVTAGVSADLCTALGDLSGSGRNEPFEITFRWARSRPLDVSTHVLAFPETSGSLLRSAATRLRDLHASGPATVTGVVEGLFDDAAGANRWRIKVRGELRTEHAEQARRAVWVRLPDQATYDQAFAAQRQRRAVTISGELSSTTGRVELVSTSGLEI